MKLLNQLPSFSAYDPGAAGEGGLDPLGLAAIADRLADILVPGLRARMSQPRFITLSAIGAIACQTLHGLTADEGKTTADIAFEWMVVEAFVQHPGQGRLEGVPGNQKAQRARKAGQRLSRRTYLNGPRVFGFTGVYRPCSRDMAVLTMDDRPGQNANRLVEAWEHDLGLDGYVAGSKASKGGKLRAKIAEMCKRTLKEGQCAVPPNSGLLEQLAECLAPREAGTSERKVLYDLLVESEHEVRNEFVAKFVSSPPAKEITQRELALQSRRGVSRAASTILEATIAYEDAATALDYCFRRFLAHATNQHGSVIAMRDALSTPGMDELSQKIGSLAKRAIDAVGEIGDDSLSLDTEKTLELFTSEFSCETFFNQLLVRHQMVQSAKEKLLWLEQIHNDWIVRTPYRNQSGSLDDSMWVHPMRLVTLANFLRWTT